MRERPILFSPPMVRAILSGTKTQTRRIVKPQPKTVADHSIASWEGDPAALLLLLQQNGRGCPYGTPGDRLWVRERAWYDREPIAGLPIRCFFEGRDMRRADGTAGLQPFACTAEMLRLNSSVRMRPSIHMPRWASRITLEITDVRVERLQDISEADATAEGATPADCCGAHYHGLRLLWEQINGAGSWDANPWVWCVSFRRVEAAKECSNG